MWSSISLYSFLGCSSTVQWSSFDFLESSSSLRKVVQEENTSRSYQNINTPEHMAPPPHTTFLFYNDYTDSYTTRLKELLPPISHFRSLDTNTGKYKKLSTVLIEAAFDSFPTLLIRTLISLPLAPTP
jgi:hypothetical protein